MEGSDNLNRSALPKRNVELLQFKSISNFDSVFMSESTRSLCTESTLNSSRGSLTSLTINTDLDLNFSNFQVCNALLYSPDSPLLPQVPARKERKPIDKSPTSYLPLASIQKAVNGDNAKNALKQRSANIILLLYFTLLYFDFFY